MPQTRQPQPQPQRRPLDGPTFQDLPHRAQIEWHYHDVQQLVYPSRGVLTISVPDGAWVVPPRRAVWIPATVPHSHQAHGRTEMRTLSFPPAVDPLGGQRPAVLAVTPLLREIIITLTDDGAAYDAPLRESMEVIALDQLRRVDELPLYLPEPADDRLRAIAALLRADPSDDRTLERLGAEVGASERTLSRLFGRETGMSFPLWRTQLRLHRALVLLAAGTSVTSTALACGYKNPSAFIEVFSKAFGTTPGRYGK